MKRGANTLRNEQKEATRELILASATRLLSQHGYAALRVAAVAKEAGVSLGGLLHHFPSKDDLVTAVLERLSDHVLNLAMEDAARDTGEADPLVLIAQSATRFYSAPEFLIYLDIFLSVRRNTIVGDTAITLLVSQRNATEELWLPHLTARGIGEKDALAIIRALWGLARGLAISSAPEATGHGNADTIDFVVRTLRQHYLGPGWTPEG